MTGVRPFALETDLRQVADLHCRVFARRLPARPGYVDRYERYFHEVFVNNPWRDESLPSLVYQEDDGRVMGFLGVIPRVMRVDGRPLRVAISSQLMVHPQRRGRAGLQLLAKFFSGPQDLSLTEGNDLLRTIWEGLGGTTALLYSIRWTRPLRPSRYVLSFMRRHGAGSRLSSAVTPLAVIMDRALEYLGGSPFRVSSPDAAGEELTGEALLRGLAELSCGRSLRPCYDDRSVHWLLARLAERNDRGQLRPVLVRSGAGEVIGWYLYYVDRRGVSEVVQIAAQRGSAKDVLGHLFQDAWAQGAAAVSGALDPRLLPALSDAQCLLHGSGGSWILAHARRPERLEPLHRGNAWLTRLDGEWWVGFPGERPA